MTILKRRPVQGIDLSMNDKQVYLPGQIVRSSKTVEAEGQHWELTINNEIWYAFKPHWKTLTDVALSMDKLRGIYINTPPSILARYINFLDVTLTHYEITTKRRAAYFLAQIGHESGGLVHSVELSDGKAYEGRKDLGNIHPGDGARYKGRGIIQLTGRHNYARAGAAIGVDLIAKPELAAGPQYASMVAGWFWQSRNLNFWSDRADFRKVTLLINGGYNGWEDRLKYLQRAEKVLEV